jgi:hypothetical protein
MHHHSGCILSPRARRDAIEPLSEEKSPSATAQPSGVLADLLAPKDCEDGEDEVASSPTPTSSESEEIEYDNAMERQMAAAEKKARSVAKAAKRAGDKCRRAGGSDSEVAVASAKAALIARRRWAS